jgi:hypothetical protein
MRGSGTSTEQAGRISTSTSLEECLTGAFYETRPSKYHGPILSNQTTEIKKRKT